MVEFTLVERDPDDPRTRNLMDYMNDPVREAEKLREKTYDAWEKRNKFGRAFGRAKTDIGTLSPLIAEIAAKFRFQPGENVVRFKQRMGILGQCDIAEWATKSGYPVGPDVPPEQEAEWRVAWFDSGKAAEWGKEAAQELQGIKEAGDKVRNSFPSYRGRS
jgi:hypothetical protein